MSFIRHRKQGAEESTPKPFPTLPILRDDGTPSDLTWTTRREALVVDALEKNDLASLRRISALPGGFGSEEMRKSVWPVLLATHRFSSPEAKALEENTPTGEVLVNSAHGNQEDPEEGETAAMLERESESTGRPLDNPSESRSHPDESQVLLDTKRSFVTYPVGLPPANKLAMQADLQDLIVGVLRKYPSLSYFQGYHDILSVLYLTFIPPKPIYSPPRSRASSIRNQRGRGTEKEPQMKEPVSETEISDNREDRSGLVEEAKAPAEEIAGTKDGRLASRDTECDRATSEWQALRQCAEVVSVCRVRDGMAKNLEGLMGLLRAADPELADFSSQISPVPTLPFFALSWILCLFSHDVDTLEPIQRMFDFLLGRNPISAIYLAVAILIAKKSQMFVLARKLGPEGIDDPSLLHPLFSRLPPLFPDTPMTPKPPKEYQELTAAAADEENPYSPIPLSEVFTLTDKMMRELPWDGEVVRGTDIMGKDSVVSTYDGGWDPDLEPSLEDVVRHVDGEIVRPGGGMDDDEDEEPLHVPVKRRRLGTRLPRNKLGISIALSIVIVGIGMGVYGLRVRGKEGDWRKWWVMVIGNHWAGKEEVVDRLRSVVHRMGRVVRQIVVRPCTQPGVSEWVDMFRVREECVSHGFSRDLTRSASNGENPFLPKFPTAQELPCRSSTPLRTILRWTAAMDAAEKGETP
ncbi:TBC1 domain family member 20, partial [Tremellales sp. Uapishka_1]